jgi:hypothetical protein
MGAVIKFDLRAVPRSERNNETLLEMIDEYTVDLLDKDWKWALCVHESGHASYAFQFSGEESEFEAPLAFSYDPSDDSFTFDEAKVWSSPPRHWRDDVKEMMAGDVVQSVLAPGFDSEHHAFASESSWGDGFSGDRVHILRALKRGRVPKSKHAKVLKEVEREIRRDLRNPAFRKAVLRRAKTYERILNRRIMGLMERAA